MKKTTKVIRFIKKEIERILIVSAILLFLATGGGILWIANLKIPDFGSFESRKISQSTKIFDKTGKILLYDIHQDIKRKVVPYEDISKDIKNATVAIEDSDFYNHYGIKPMAILRAVFVNLTSGSKVQGGSTITQQVIKNSILTSEKSYTRKIKEWILALKLERVMDKEHILSLYLNESPYGGTTYGVEEASQRFFNKSAKDVTLAEAAYLAALPQAPTFYSPYGQNKDKLDERKNLVLNRMVELNFISKEEAEKAKNEQVVFISKEEKGGIKAPHFVEYVRSYLENKYGKEVLETGGLNVTTTLDWELQKEAEQVVSDYGKINEEQFGAKNAGMIGIDPKTGQILVMVGSRDYFNTENDGNFNVTLAHRQPGSAFKPFVYATAFKQGYIPDTVLFDLPTEFQTTCTPEGLPISSEVDPADCYMPENYDGIYRGPIKLRDALAQSINIPAIKLLYLVGIENAIQTARDLGITGLTDANQYGLTLVLGGGEVTPLDITSAYSVFANDGIRNPATPILKVVDSSGSILEEYSDNGVRVLDENVARQINNVLSDFNAKLPAYGENSPLHFYNREVASKTGTTNDTKDAWVVGYTPNFALGVWVGNNDNTPMVKKVAGMITAPMWRAFFDKALLTLPAEKFTKPAEMNTDSLKPVLRGDWRGGFPYTIDKASGKLSTEYTPPEMKEIKTVTQVHTILYWLNKKDPLGPAPIYPQQDPQFNSWETSVRRWAAEQKIQEESISVIPTAADDIHGPNFAPKINIVSPDQNREYPLNEKIGLFFTSSPSKYPITQADFFINDTFIGSSKNAPFSFYFVPSDIPQIKNVNNLKVIIYDSVRNSGENNSIFKVAI
ncbi:MAG TPA: PBP1A family penicillin-binding protein [Candidatus Paceibacterota bacterium]|nr:PBP1A family penicillin-binding protein [Candidatus Paceibacterota bacterium]